MFGNKEGKWILKKTEQLPRITPTETYKYSVRNKDGEKIELELSWCGELNPMKCKGREILLHTPALGVITTVKKRGVATVNKYNPQMRSYFGTDKNEEYVSSRFEFNEEWNMLADTPENREKAKKEVERRFLELDNSF